MWPVHQLYNTLIEVDSALHLKPSIAKSWTFSSDKKSITFQLRSDVYFHDDACFAGGKGRKVIASDVVYSLNRIINPAVASPGAWIFNNKLDSINPFQSIDDSTFLISMQSPFVPMLGILSMPYCSIVPKEAIEQYGADFRKHPVGTGPFCLLKWQEGERLVLKKNLHYFEKDENGYSFPYLDGVSIQFLDSKTTEFLAFEQHQLDSINDPDAAFKDEILTKSGELKSKWNAVFNVRKHPFLNTEYLGILFDTNSETMKNSPLRLANIRKAINHAIDRKKLLFYMRNSIGNIASSGFVPVGLPSFDTSLKGFEYNPDKAKALIRAAGFDDAHPMPTITLTTVPNYAAIGSFIVNELQQLGINAKVEIVQKSLLLEEMSAGQVSLFRGSWIADYPEASNFFSVFYGKNPAPPNYTRYQNQAFDSLYEIAIAEPIDSIRYDLYRKMEMLIMDDAPVIPLWYDMSIQLIHKNISGFYSNSMNMLELKWVKITAVD
jgi:peptide/nickel transport system substrate-binding protein